ncbi:MAG: hypothetical protein ACJA2U_002738, partial [Marinomonas primoryensis]
MSIFSRFLFLCVLPVFFSNVIWADEAQILSSLKKVLPQYDVGSVN